MTKNVRVFDIGYSNVKADFRNNGIERMSIEGIDYDEYMIPAIVGNARDIKYNTGLHSKEYLKNLEVEFMGLRRFVGDLARRQSDQVIVDLDENRYANIDSKILLETTLGILNQQYNEEVGVVTGLPLDHIKHKDFLKEYLLYESHIIDINGTTKRTNVVDVEILPQPMLVFFDEFLNNDGTIKRKEFSNSVVGVLDIGFGTTDLSFVRDLEFIDKFSRSKDIAMSTVYKQVNDMVYNEFSIDKELYEIEQDVRNKFVRIRKEDYDITEIVEYVKSDVAYKIVNWVQNIWKQHLDSIDYLIIAGGGGEALGNYITHLIGGDVVINSQLSVLRGATKVANRLYGVDV